MLSQLTDLGVSYSRLCTHSPAPQQKRGQRRGQLRGSSSSPDPGACLAKALLPPVFRFHQYLRWPAGLRSGSGIHPNLVTLALTPRVL